MDEQFRPNYINDVHNENANRVKAREEERRQAESINRQRAHINDYLKYDTTQAAEQRIHRMKNGSEVLKAKGFSLFSMKESTERIYHKDKEHHATRKNTIMEAVKARYQRENPGQELSDSKASLAYEYGELLGNCRVFDNEVRETVQETLAQHPDLLQNYQPAEQREEVLARLVTAFLPEREFHFDPPSGNQKSFVKDYLKSFRKNPVGAIKKMQQSLRGERLHRDFMDVNAGMQNFRMLYTDMVKREALARVFPHIEDTTPADRYEVEKMNEGVEARKTMIRNLFRMNGMTFREDTDLEFNAGWVNTKTLTGQTKAQKRTLRENQAKSGYKLTFSALQTQAEGDKEAILAEYFQAYNTVREKEREINRYYKDQITAGITERGTMFNPEVLHKNYRSVQRFVTQQARADLFKEQSERVEVPFLSNLDPQQTEIHEVAVNSEQYHAHKYLLKELKRCIQDANYTRYRRERLKKMKASGTLPAGVLEKNRQKEELRLRLLENRIADFEALTRRMEAGNFNPNAIEDQRLARLYETEIRQKAKSMQEEQALFFYSSDADYNMRQIEADYEIIKQEKLRDDAGGDNLSVPKSLYEEFLKRENKLRKYRLWQEMRTLYHEGLERKKAEWRKEEKLSEAKKIGRELLQLPIPVDEFDMTREKQLQLEILRSDQSLQQQISPKGKVDMLEDEDKKKLFGMQLIEWRYNLSDEDKEARYFKLMGRDRSKEKPNEEGFSKEDLWELKKEEKELLIRYYSSDTYWKYKETFDEKGNIIVPGKEIDLTEQKKEEVDFGRIEAIFREHRKKIYFDENRVYPEEIKNYFNDKHLEREGGFNHQGSPLGCVKFNIEHYVNEYKNELKKREEEVREARLKQQRMLDNKDAQEGIIRNRQESMDVFLESIKAAVESYEKKDLSEAGILLITPADLMKAADIFQSAYDYFNENKEEMLPEVQKKAVDQMTAANDFQKRLWNAFNVQYSVIEQKTAEEMPALEKLMTEGPAVEAKALAEKMENRIKAILFDKKLLKQTDTKQEEKFKELRRKVGIKRVQCTTELNSGRSQMVKEIRDLESVLTAEPKEEDAQADRIMGVTNEVRTLRRASLLALRCAAYLDHAMQQTSEDYDWTAFSRTNDLEYVKKTLADLKKTYLPQLENKLIGEGYQKVHKTLDKIATERSKEKMRIAHTADKSVKAPELQEPELRYRIKYAKAYLVLANYEEEEEGKKKTKKKADQALLAKQQEERETKLASVRNRLQWIQRFVFEERYTGLETEEEEEKLLSEIRGKAEEIRRQKEEMERELIRQANNQVIQDRLETDKPFVQLMETVLDLKKTDQEAWQVYDENSRAYAAFLKEGKDRYLELEEQYRVEREKMIELFMMASDLEKSGKNPEQYEKVKSDIQKQGLVVKEVIRSRDSIWKKASAALQAQETNRQMITKKRETLLMNLNDLIQKEPSFFETDPEKQMENDNELVNEVVRLRIVLENDKFEQVLQKKSEQDAAEFLTFMLGSRGEYLLRTAEERIGDAKKGGSRALSSLRDLYQEFIRDIQVIPGIMNIPGVSEKMEAFNAKYHKKETEITLGYLGHLKGVSDQVVKEKIDKLPDQPVIDMKTLNEINSIITGRMADMDEVRKQIGELAIKDDGNLQEYLDFCSRNYDSPEMKALKAKIEKPLTDFAGKQSERTETALRDLKSLRGEKKEERLMEIRALFGEIEAYTRILTSFAPGIGVLDALETLEKAQRKLEDAADPEEAARKHAEKLSKMSDTDVFEMLDELSAKEELDDQDLKDLEHIRKTYEGNQKNKTFQNRLSKDPEAKKKFESYGKNLKALEEKAEQSKAVEGLMTDFDVLFEEISGATSNTKTLKEKDLQHLKTLKRSLEGLAKGKVYLGLLKKEDRRVKELRDAMERENQRIDRRLALHETEKTVKEELVKLEKDRDALLSAKDPGSNMKAQEERAASLDALRRRYEQLEDSEDYIDLCSEQIGDFQQDVVQTVKTLKKTSSDIKLKVLEAQFALLYKDAMETISRSAMGGGSSEKENEKLRDIRTSLTTFRVNRYYRDLQNDQGDDTRFTSLQSGIASLQQQLSQMR